MLKCHTDHTGLYLEALRRAAVSDLSVRPHTITFQFNSLALHVD